MRRWSTATSLMLVATLIAPINATAQEEEAAEAFGSDNMTHVESLPYRPIDPDVEPLPYGTDIEFAEVTTVDGEMARLAGSTRIGTAVALSADTFPSASTVVLATAFTYADALAGAPLATQLDAPVLLTGVDALPAETVAEIQRLGAANVILLGGEAAISAAVADEVAALGLNVERLSGPNRFATAAAVAERMGNHGEVLIAEGEDADPTTGWETAISAGALGAVHGIPLLLVNGTRLPEETAALLAEDLDVTIVGSTEDVSTDVATEVDELAGEVTRIGGTSFAETATLVAAESIDRGALGSRVHIATSAAFADGLVAGATVGRDRGILLLVDGLAEDGAATALQFLSDSGLADRGLRNLRVAGGTAAISDAVADAVATTLAEGGETRQFALGGSEFNGMQIVDITDPTDSYIAAVWDCRTTQGDIQVFEQDGSVKATFSSEDTSSLGVTSECVQAAVAEGDIVFPDEPTPADPASGTEAAPRDGVPDDFTPGYGAYVVDLSDPFNPTYAGHIPVPEGTHNMTVHPSGDYAYTSNSSLIINPVTSQGEETTYVEYYDISDLDDIQRLGQLDMPRLPGLGTESHDITFNADGTRAYSAALSNTVIIDTTDPAAPSVISNFVDPAINVEHQADPVTVTDSEGNVRDLLIVEDELAGAAGNGFCPGGGMHIYDITGDNELNPQLHKVGTYFIPQFRPAGSGSGQGEALTCTAHVFRVYPEQEIITIAWYNAGVWVLDYSGLADEATDPSSSPIQTLGWFYFADSDTWSFKTNAFEADGSFYGYGNDITRGMDVYRYDASIAPGPDPAGASSAGTWVDQDTAIRMAQVARVNSGLTLGEQAMPRCLIGVSARG